MPTVRDGATIRMDDQPISATFFGEGRWLTDFITPDELEVKKLHKDITKGISDRRSRVIALQRYVGGRIRYEPFVSATLTVEGKTSKNRDAWLAPSITKLVGVGNCANKSFLLTSLLRNDFEASEVYSVLGNLHGDDPGGHAWVQLTQDDATYIIESTRGDIPSMIPIDKADRYEAIHLFNDKVTYVIPGRTQMKPYAASYSTWLKDYLDMAYIQGRK